MTYFKSPYLQDCIDLKETLLGCYGYYYFGISPPRSRNITSKPTDIEHENLDATIDLVKTLRRRTLTQASEP